MENIYTFPDLPSTYKSQYFLSPPPQKKDLGMQQIITISSKLTTSPCADPQML